jgi:hypothetical protein
MDDNLNEAVKAIERADHALNKDGDWSRQERHDRAQEAYLEAIAHGIIAVAEELRRARVSGDPLTRAR